MNSFAHLAKTASTLCRVVGLGLYPLEPGSTERNYVRTGQEGQGQSRASCHIGY